MRPLHQHVIEAPLAELLPTQATIGYVEVHQKRVEWQALTRKVREEQIAKHWFPTVIGPAGRHYIIDHHHLDMEASYLPGWRGKSSN
jgi:hypothetical protein